MKYTDIVKKAQRVKVEAITKSSATYSVEYEGSTYSFPVDLNDIGTATLLPIDKPIYYSRYIRKAIEDKTFIKIA